MSELLYGRQAVYESLRARRRAHHRLVLAEGVRPATTISRIISLAEQAGIPIRWVSRGAADLPAHVHHQGVVLETGPYPYVLLDSILTAAHASGEPPLLLLLDLVQDPQNLGALLRTGEAVGVHGVVLQRRRAGGITPAVVHVSAGAAEHLRVAQVTNLVRTIEELKTQGLWVIGLEAIKEAKAYDQADFSLPLALVIGSEGEGLRRLVRERCDILVRLPMRGRVTSLNAAVAGAVVLYEILRQRQGGGL
ncbi:MAG: 23S rRNA (guanosine(2251)-2'-O)-methyltransferase RlmB [Anaerolineae bacterium]|nr:23S rRNA (guanosine(2251)-2'-O)-methyltransferase RlmB [Anaerolineae bacterium]